MLFDIEPLEKPQQIGWVWYDKMNLVEKKKFIKNVKIKDFFNEFLYRKFNDFDSFLSQATRK
jgi:hypothetical protein